MINPVHSLKKFVKYSGDGKADDYHVTEVRGWLGSGVTDCNGVEIYEGDIVKFDFLLAGEILSAKSRVSFENGKFSLRCAADYMPLTFGKNLEVVGHIATE